LFISQLEHRPAPPSRRFEFRVGDVLIGPRDFQRGGIAAAIERACDASRSLDVKGTVAAGSSGARTYESSLLDTGFVDERRIDQYVDAGAWTMRMFRQVAPIAPRARRPLNSPCRPRNVVQTGTAPDFTADVGQRRSASARLSGGAV
jgi:hypothetical protein